MEKNMKGLDRALRIIAAGIIAFLYIANVLTGAFAVVLGIVAVTFVATSFAGFCPLYALVKRPAR